MDHMSAGATSHPWGPSAKVVISDGTDDDTVLAHELGHVMGLDHPAYFAEGQIRGGEENTIMQTKRTRNTMYNYARILWPAPSGPTCLDPDL